MPVLEGLHDEETARTPVALLDGQNPPTAIFSSQNLVTIGAIRALRELGRHHDIALVGFDDIALADLLDPGITVIAQDPQRIGRDRRRARFARLDGDLTPRRVRSCRPG